MSGLIDFYEIQWDHDFERFGMGFLEAKGYKIVRRPGLGGDGGKDMIVSHTDVFGGEFKWLVSCKHRVKSARSIGVADDQASYETLYRFGCHGFLFLYSKPPTEDLIRSIEEVATRARVPYRILSDTEIERDLVSDPGFYVLINQFYPNSYQRLVHHVTQQQCACGYEMGSIYLIPFTDEHGLIQHQRVCGYCYATVQSGLEDARLRYGAGVCIKYEPDI